MSVCAWAITQVTQYTNIAAYAQENGRTVFEGCSLKQSGVTLKAAKGIYVAISMLQCVAHVPNLSSRLNNAYNGSLAKT